MIIAGAQGLFQVIHDSVDVIVRPADIEGLAILAKLDMSVEGNRVARFQDQLRLRKVAMRLKADGLCIVPRPVDDLMGQRRRTGSEALITSAKPVLEFRIIRMGRISPPKGVLDAEATQVHQIHPVQDQVLGLSARDDDARNQVFPPVFVEETFENRVFARASQQGPVHATRPAHVCALLFHLLFAPFPEQFFLTPPLVPGHSASFLIPLVPRGPR